MLRFSKYNLKNEGQNIVYSWISSLPHNPPKKEKKESKKLNTFNTAAEKTEELMYSYSKTFPLVIHI